MSDPLTAGLVTCLIVFVISFLLGSIPWGVIISRVFFHTDIRQHGSGNIGTTNAMRSLGKVGGGAVFVLDFGKGLAAGAIALALLEALVPNAGHNPGVLVRYNEVLCVTFLGCVWGHIFSPWLGFKGGKGIAVAIGCLFVTFGIFGAFFELAVFILVVAATRYVSAGSIAAAGICPFVAAFYYLFLNFSPIAFAFCTVAALTVVWAHRENIQRLRAGNERRIGDKKKEAAAEETEEADAE